MDVSRACDFSSMSQQAANTKDDVFSIIFNGIANAQQQITLVSKDGQRFFVHEKDLKASSDFFQAALEIGMRESGKRQMSLSLSLSLSLSHLL